MHLTNQALQQDLKGSVPSAWGLGIFSSQESNKNH